MSDNKSFQLVSKGKDAFLHLCSPEILVLVDSISETSGLEFEESRHEFVEFLTGFHLSFIFCYPHPGRP